MPAHGDQPLTLTIPTALSALAAGVGPLALDRAAVPCPAAAVRGPVCPTAALTLESG